ncbi:MAG: hypothetical protein AABX53_01780 [Nanoarchaeota archaeon]
MGRARNPRLFLLFLFGFAFTFLSLSLFLFSSYLDYFNSLVLLSPGELEPSFFTSKVIAILVLYAIVFLVLCAGLFYSWRGYRTLEPAKSSRAQKLDGLRKKSPFFKRP